MWIKTHMGKWRDKAQENKQKESQEGSLSEQVTTTIVQPHIITTNLAIYPIETSQDKLQKHEQTVYYYSHLGAWQTRHVHAHFSETIKIDENLFKKLIVKNSFTEKTYVVGTHWNCLYEVISLYTNNIYILQSFWKRCLRCIKRGPCDTYRKRKSIGLLRIFKSFFFPRQICI